jgi:hypothetical protein
MKSLFFFMVLIVTLTLIYVSLVKTSIKIEFFENPSTNSISNQLGINSSRIHNFKETGDINNTDQYQIYFEIYPRLISEPNSLSIKDLLDKIKKMSDNRDAFNIKTANGVDVFLAKINVEETNKPNPGKSSLSSSDNNSKIISKFMDPSIDGQVKYLKYKKTGIKEEPELEPRYKFEKGSLVLEPIPTTSYTPTSVPTPFPTNYS